MSQYHRPEDRSKLPGDLTWPKLLGTSLAAVFTAWLAGHFGLGNTMTGVALGSVIATFGTAIFTSGIDRSHQVITERRTVVRGSGADDPTVVQQLPGVAGDATRVERPVATDDPSLIQRPVEDAPFPADPDAHETTVFSRVTDPLGAPVGPQPSRWSRINWRAVVLAAIITMAITLLAITLYEGVVGRTWGSDEPGTTIGNTVRGGPVTPAAPTVTASPTDEPSEEPTPTEEPSEEPTPTEEPSQEPTPGPTPTPSQSPTPSPSPSATTSSDPDPIIP